VDECKPLPLLGPRMADIVIAMKLGDFPMPVDDSGPAPGEDVEGRCSRACGGGGSRCTGVAGGSAASVAAARATMGRSKRSGIPAEVTWTFLGDSTAHIIRRRCTCAIACSSWRNTSQTSNNALLPPPPPERSHASSVGVLRS